MTFELIAEDDKISVLLEDHPEIEQALIELGITQIDEDLTVKKVAELVEEDPDIIVAKLNLAVFGITPGTEEDLSGDPFEFQEE